MNSFKTDTSLVISKVAIQINHYAPCYSSRNLNNHVHIIISPMITDGMLSWLFVILCVCVCLSVWHNLLQNCVFG